MSAAPIKSNPEPSDGKPAGSNYSGRRLPVAAVVAVVLLATVVLAARYAVQHYRRPGSMSVIEAQAMDMSVMKPPVGAVPVAVARVTRGEVQGALHYTGSTLAFNEAEIAPRVTGRIIEMPVYPGDRVRAGQLLVRLDSDELRAKETGARLAREAARQDRLVAGDEADSARASQAQARTEAARSNAMAREAAAEIVHARASVVEAHSMVEAKRRAVAQARNEGVAAREDKRMAQANLEDVQAALTDAQGEVENAQAMAASVSARLPQAQADVQAAQADVQLARDKRQRSADLLKQGAISKEEFQVDETAFQNAEAKVKSAQGKVTEVQADMDASQAKVRQAQAGVRSAQAKIRASTAALARSDAVIATAGDKLAQSQAELAAEQVKVTHAHADTDAAQAKLEQARAGAEGAQALAQGAGAGVSKAGHQEQRAGTMAAQADAQLSEAAIVRGYTEIRATSDGVVLQRLVAPGSLVSPGTTVLRLAQIDPIRFQANIASSDLNKVRVGMPVTVRSTADASKAIRTRVSAVFPSADPQSRTGIVEATVPNSNERFKPGEYVTMDIAASQTMGTLKIPSEAIIQQPDTGDENSGQVIATRESPMVWVMERAASAKPAIYTCTMHPQIRSDKPGTCPICHMNLTPLEAGGQYRARFVPIKIGASDGNFTELLGGIEEGAQVIARGYDDLKNGDAVVPAKFGSDGPLELPAATASGDDGGMMPPKKAIAAPPQPVQANEIRVTADDKGFTPASFQLRKGVQARITFTRTTDATCATEVVWPDYGITQKLPLNKPVTVTITPKRDGPASSTFTCGMKMFSGTVTLR